MSEEGLRARLALFPDTHHSCQGQSGHTSFTSTEKATKLSHHSHACTGSMGSLPGFSARRETGEDGSRTLTSIKSYNGAGQMMQVTKSSASLQARAVRTLALQSVFDS